MKKKVPKKKKKSSKNIFETKVFENTKQFDKYTRGLKPKNNKKEQDKIFQISRFIVNKSKKKMKEERRKKNKKNLLPKNFEKKKKKKKWRKRRKMRTFRFQSLSLSILLA